MAHEPQLDDVGAGGERALGHGLGHGGGGEAHVVPEGEALRPGDGHEGGADAAAAVLVQLRG